MSALAIMHSSSNTLWTCGLGAALIAIATVNLSKTRYVESTGIFRKAALLKDLFADT
jgi:hypothetical protein